MHDTGKKYDIFISYASEDRNDVVSPLAHRLELLGLKVWYDEFSLLPGDSLSASIDKGISDSRYGLLVLSPNFLNKNWTDYEYRSLLTRQIDGEKILIPLWYDISKEKVKSYSLYLTDIKGIILQPNNIQQVAIDILRVVRPDRYRELLMMDTLRKLIENGKTKLLDISELHSQKQKQSKLTRHQILRAKIIFYGIGRHLNLTFQEYIDGYEFDVVPERELQTWEIMNACYLEILDTHPGATESEKHNIYQALLLLSIGCTDLDFGLSSPS